MNGTNCKAELLPSNCSPSCNEYVYNKRVGSEQRRNLKVKGCSKNIERVLKKCPNSIDRVNCNTTRHTPKVGMVEI
jgi:hypothetical protein